MENLPSFLQTMNPPYHKIFVEDYALNLTIGVYEREHKQPQPVRVSVELYLAPPDKAIDDNIANVLNYEWIPVIIERVAKQPRMNLLETFADRLCEHFFADARVRAVRIKLTKTQICPKARELGFEIFRSA